MTTRQELPPSSSPGAEVVAILNQRRAVMHPWCERQHCAVISGGCRSATTFSTSSPPHIITGLVPVIPIR
jgi:hypothetical protein